MICDMDNWLLSIWDILFHATEPCVHILCLKVLLKILSFFRIIIFSDFNAHCKPVHLLVSKIENIVHNGVCVCVHVCTIPCYPVVQL